MPRKILIVEDDTVTASILRDALAREFQGYEVKVARTLRDALFTIHSSGPPSAVILDLTLLDSNRDETLSHLNDIKAICPVAIVTGHSADDIRARAAAHPDVPIYEKIGNSEPSMLTKVIQFAVQALGPSRLDNSISRSERILESPPPYDSR